MGTDIHGVIVSKDNKFINVLENTDRNYNLFKFLANIRDRNVPVFSDPRGAHEFVTVNHDEDNYQDMYYGYYWLGYHSPTYFTLHEIIEFFKKSFSEYPANDNEDYIIRCISRWIEDIERIIPDCLTNKDTLILIGFDS